MKNYGMLDHFVPLIAPIDAAATAKTTPYVDLKDALACTFLVFLGVITATSADQNITITVEASSAASSNSGEAQMAFNYRKSGAVGADSWGAVTAAAAATGISVDTTAEDNKMYLIEVDPAAVQGAITNKNGRYARVVVAPDAGGTVTLLSVMALLIPRHAGTSMVSST